MNREQILQAITDLAKSQGSYARLLQSIYNAPEDARDAFLSTLEAQHFKDAVDLVLYLET